MVGETIDMCGCINSSLEKLETLLHDAIPKQYRDFVERASYEDTLEYVIDAAGKYWAVDEFFMPNCHGRNMDEIYVAVCHAIPPGSFPFLSTLGGFLIIFGDSKADPNVYYWDHEQEAGAHEVTKVASSAVELREIVVEFDETIG